MDPFDWLYLVAFTLTSASLIPLAQTILLSVLPCDFGLLGAWVLHWAGQLVYHRNINRLVVRRFRNKYGLLQGGMGTGTGTTTSERRDTTLAAGELKTQSPRFRWKDEEVVWVKLRGALGGALRTSSRTYVLELVRSIQLAYI
jgi:hypothetical protein